MIIDHHTSTSHQTDGRADRQTKYAVITRAIDIDGAATKT